MGIGRTNLLVSEKEKLVTAYHEGGHTLIGLLTEGAMKLHKVTILPVLLYIINLFTKKERRSLRFYRIFSKRRRSEKHDKNEYYGINLK
jgi:ATP-dependent Zn protease